MRDRTGDLLIAISLALFPLLPAGPTYLGFRWPWALEVFFLSVAVAGILLIAPFRARADAPPPATSETVRLVRIGYLTWLIPVAAATLIGLMERSPADWEFWRAEADGLLVRLGHSMHQVVEPFYPLRVGLTYFEGGLAFWLLSAAFKRTGDRGRRINSAIDGCLIGIGLVSTIAIVQYITRANLLDYWVRANPGLTRSHSTLDDPNGLASFLVLGIGLVAGVAWPTSNEPIDWRRSRGPLLILVLAGAALVSTVSRAGLAALVIAAVVGSIIWRASDRRAGTRPARLIGRTAAALILGGLIVSMAGLMLAPRATELPDTPSEAFWQTLDWRQPLDRILKGRLNIWKAAVDFGEDEPLLGIGVGQFPRLYSSYPSSDGPENAHNFFLQVFAETGLLGLAGLSVLLGTVMVGLRHRSAGRSPAHQTLAGWLSVGVLAFVLTWVTGHPLLNLSNQLWFAAVVAVGLAALRER